MYAVRVYWSDGSYHDDAIAGHDRDKAMANARWNWMFGTPREPATRIEYLGPEPLGPDGGLDDQAGAVTDTTPEVDRAPSTTASYPRLPDGSVDRAVTLPYVLFDAELSTASPPGWGLTPGVHVWVRPVYPGRSIGAWQQVRLPAASARPTSSPTPTLRASKLWDRGITAPGSGRCCS
jgi:hypothetical protein